MENDGIRHTVIDLNRLSFSLDTEQPPVGGGPCNSCPAGNHRITAMNQTIATILKRRSVRAFLQDPIGQNEVGQILEAGRYAPSAMNQQPWHFTVVRDREVLDRLETTCRNAFVASEHQALRSLADNPDFSVLYQAPMLIIVSGSRTAMAAQYDCTLAMENMMIAATSLHIGSCWTHAIMMTHAAESGKTAINSLGLDFPDGFQPYAAAVFGYPAGPWPAAPARRNDCISFIG